MLKRVLLDTNILIDHLRGVEAAAIIIEQSSYHAISALSRIEVLTGTDKNAPDMQILDFLNRFDTLAVDIKIADAATTFIQHYKLNMPDAIIAATAKVHNLILLTRDQELSKVGLNTVVPYAI